jgi:hypothetical protein
MVAAGMYFYFKRASSYNCASVFESVIFYEYHSEAKAFLVFKLYLFYNCLSFSKYYLLNKYALLKSWHVFCHCKCCAINFGKLFAIANRVPKFCKQVLYQSNFQILASNLL